MHIALLLGLVLFSILAILVRDLLKAAIALAVASIMLAIILFRMGAFYVGVFEISVVAGLITVLFISTIALTRGEQDVKESKVPLVIFPVFFIAFIVIDFVLMGHLLGKLATLPARPEIGSFGKVLWNQRTFDLVGQIGVIFAGVFAVLALFRKRKDDE